MIDFEDLDALADRLGPAVELALDGAAAEAARAARKAAGGGAIARSITVRRVGTFARELVAGDPGAIFLERGRGPAVAREGGVLHFVVAGRDVFTRRVGPAKARPFMAPAAAVLETKGAELLERAVGEASR